VKIKLKYFLKLFNNFSVMDKTGLLNIHGAVIMSNICFKEFHSKKKISFRINKYHKYYTAFNASTDFQELGKL
jgi:hypothetical protein